MARLAGMHEIEYKILATTCVRRGYGPHEATVARPVDDVHGRRHRMETIFGDGSQPQAYSRALVGAGSGSTRSLFMTVFMTEAVEKGRFARRSPGKIIASPPRSAASSSRRGLVPGGEGRVDRIAFQRQLGSVVGAKGSSCTPPGDGVRSSCGRHPAGATWLRRSDRVDTVARWLQPRYPRLRTLPRSSPRCWGGRVFFASLRVPAASGSSPLL